MLVYFNFTAKINSPNRKKRGEYGSALDMSKNTLSVGSFCNSNNDDFEEIVG
jgi:hypothetical protein